MSRPAQLGDLVTLLDTGGDLAMYGCTDPDYVTVGVWVLQDYDAQTWGFRYRINLLAMEASPPLKLWKSIPRLAVINERELLMAQRPRRLLHCDIDGVFLGNVESKEHENRSTLSRHRFQESMVLVPLFDVQAEEDAVSNEPPPFVMFQTLIIPFREFMAFSCSNARLTREQRELHRFRNVLRKDDFICLERVKGQLVNILAGLELHAGVFSTAEQKRIVDCVYGLQEMGKRGELGDRTYTEPEKWMRGKGRVTIQFGCCYNYATDRKGNPPGIIRTFVSDPIPELFKVMIKRLVRWRILPTDCVPDSCIVNMYDPGDCIPPHIDSHDFVRPFCTVSFLSECDILFGSSLKIAGPGEFTGSFAIPLPVGSVLVINGNGADVAKHCVPAVPSKRISITFRKMDPAKRPFSFKDDPELLNITPLEAPAAPETSRSSDEGKGKQLGVQTRDPGSRSSRSRKSKGRTTPAGKVGWGGILGDQPPQHPQSPISSVSSDRERDSIGWSREPRYPPSSDRERDSVERPREPRYPRDAPSHGEDLRDRLNRPPHERTPGSGAFFVNNGADSQARGQRMEHRQLQMINRTINDDMDSLSVGSHESSEQPRVSVRTIHNRPRTRINLGW
ncbi:uncharacterized protein [Triticum aestivum]|uniref:uncharacterized protein n=1 Tax=Triticum aestivum TaxID=4565 RepID=UPI001D021AD1|nr:uncharacterized protein LOC123170735 [Triticum aestivum]